MTPTNDDVDREQGTDTVLKYHHLSYGTNTMRLLNQSMFDDCRLYLPKDNVMNFRNGMSRRKCEKSIGLKVKEFTTNREKR